MSFDFRPHPRIHARLDHIGAERPAVLVVENFAGSPETLVDRAASLAPFPPAAQTFYPGVRAPVPMSFVQGVYAYLEPTLRAVFGLADQEVVSGGWDFSMVTKAPADLTVRQRMPHIDSTNRGNLALLLYLCAPDQGGTSFYRHRGTGYETITEDRFDHYEATLKSELDARGPPVGYINGDTPLFERVADYAAAFNRMLVYWGGNLHSANIGEAFARDPDPRRGRLTLNLFLHFRPKAGEAP